MYTMRRPLYCAGTFNVSLSIVFISLICQFLLLTFELLQEVNLNRSQFIPCAFLELLVLRISFRFSQLGRDSSSMRQNILSGYTQEIIQNGNPVLHVHGAMLLCL